MIQQGKEQWEDQVQARCKELSDQAQESLVNEEKAEKIYQHCIDAAGGTIEDDSEQQEDNFTKECLAKFEGLNGSALFNLGNLKQTVNDWIQGTDFSSTFSDMLERQLGNDTLNMDELKEKFPDCFEDEGTEDASRLRLFDDAVRLPQSPKGGYAVLSCLLGSGLAAAVGLAMVLRRRKAQASDHESLATA